MAGFFDSRISNAADDIGRDERGQKPQNDDHDQNLDESEAALRADGAGRGAEKTKERMTKRDYIAKTRAVIKSLFFRE